MAGIAAAFGEKNSEAVERMLDKMAHRGPEFVGVDTIGEAVLGQNYLPADSPPKTNGSPKPVAGNPDRGYRICYDGQMGNLPELAEKHGIKLGPAAEERLVLKLFQEIGSDALSELDDAVFAFVISDGKTLFAARDLLGIKTLFYGWKDGALYLSTELKGIVSVTDNFTEFPAGHFMDEKGTLTRFAELPAEPPPTVNTDVDKAVRDIRDIIERSFHNRIDFSVPTASLLSGGIDSSVIACIASKAYKEKFGSNAKLKTFALGVGESEDIKNARLVSDRIGSQHHELIITLDDILEVLPEVIYHLESFDPSLVRSAASNFLISRYAKQEGIHTLLSGEGGDEVFCGYIYLKQLPLEELHKHQMRCIGFLHNNASLRLDRMNQCNGIRVVAPLISGELLRYSLATPPEFRQKPENGDRIEKWIFRKAFEDDLPEQVVWRIKLEFSQGSGSAGVLPDHFEKTVADEAYEEARARFPVIRSKEELYYFNIFVDAFGDKKAIETVGQWITI